MVSMPVCLSVLSLCLSVRLDVADRIMTEKWSMSLSVCPCLTFGLAPAFFQPLLSSQSQTGGTPGENFSDAKRTYKNDVFQR